MRICIYGAGAMGVSFGALLQQTMSVPIDFVTRNVLRVKALNERGAELISGNTKVVVPVRAILPEQMSGAYDIVFLATKQRGNTQTAQFLKQYVADDGALVTLQNGFPEPELADIIGENRVYGCTLSWGAEAADTGKTLITSDAGFYVGLGAYGKGSRLAEIGALLSPAFKLTVGNLYEMRFAKLAINSSFSTLSTISGLPFGVIAKKYRKYAVGLIREAFAVARAYGCQKLPLNGHNLFRVLTFGGGILLSKAMKRYRDTRSGMLKDLASGRRCDIDFISGVIVRCGEKKAIQTPLTARAVELVHDIENGLAEIAPETISLM